MSDKSPKTIQIVLDFSPKILGNVFEKQPNIMKRFVDQEFRGWKKSKSWKSLLFRGARQVGKTFSVRKLEEMYFDFY